MKFSVTSYHAVAVWKWDTHPSSSDQHKLYHYAKPSTGDDNGYGYGDDEDEDDDDEEDDVCGICRLAFESTCPECKIPGDDCPLIWGECTHVFHMHCLLKWIDTESSKGQCPMDRRPWETMDRAPDRLPTTTTGAPVLTVPSGPIPTTNPNTDPTNEQEADANANAEEADTNNRTRGEGEVRFEIPGPPSDVSEAEDEDEEDEDEGMDVDLDADTEMDDAELHPVTVRI